MNSGAFTIVIVVVLLLFVVYRRATNLLTRQKVRPHALAVRLGIFAVLGLLVLACWPSASPTPLAY